MLSTTLSQRSVSFGRFSPDQTQKLKELNVRRLNQPGAVTVTDLEGEAKAAEQAKNSKTNSSLPWVVWVV